MDSVSNKRLPLQNQKFKLKNMYNIEDVEKIIHYLLQHPDLLIDAISNDNTEWDAKSLLELAIK